MRVRCANCRMVYDKVEAVKVCPSCESNASDPEPGMNAESESHARGQKILAQMGERRAAGTRTLQEG